MPTRAARRKARPAAVLYTAGRPDLARSVGADALTGPARSFPIPIWSSSWNPIWNPILDFAFSSE